MTPPNQPRIRDSITECIGGTPLVRLTRLAEGLPVELIAKVENLNPLWSVKDRIALAMIESAERSGELRSGMTVLEATSGNTGIGLAFICAARGYRLRVVMPGKTPEQIGKLLDQAGIAVRAGHHCAQPSLRRFGLEATVRPSLALYNTTADIDRLADALHRIR